MSDFNQLKIENIEKGQATVAWPLNVLFTLEFVLDLLKKSFVRDDIITRQGHGSGTLNQGIVCGICNGGLGEFSAMGCSVATSEGEIRMDRWNYIADIAHVNGAIA